MEKLKMYRKMLEDQERSGLCVREFCFTKGIATATFYNRKKKLQELEQLPRLAPIAITSPKEDAVAEKNFVPILGNDALEIKYPNGLELRFTGKVTGELIKSLLNPLS